MAFSWKEEQLTFLKVELDLEDCVMPIENRLGLVDTGPAPFISSMEW